MCGAGGITYGCWLLAPGMIIGEDAHWTDETDKPVRCNKFDTRYIEKPKEV